ncbi:MAG: 6-phosphofructokinase [Clostridia bacterium]|nr:6-phosphofructokinase [Clostridia bacterium]
MGELVNAVVGQSGGPTCAINATLAGVIKGCLDCGKIDTLYGMKNGIEGFEKEDFISLLPFFQRNPERQLDLLSATPAAALGSCRKKISQDCEIEEIYRILEKYSIRYFFYIGGNDSMDTVMKLSDYAKRNADKNLYDVKFIGIPKTIDNDLGVTDHTPGYGSAAKFVATTMQEICRDCAVYTKKAVTIVEIMGRDAGWLTASSVLAKFLTGAGPDLVYLPEKPFDEDAFIKDLNKKLSSDEKPYVVVAVSEGIKFADGTYVAEKRVKVNDDPFGHNVLTGAGKALENMVADRIGCKCRSIELNVLQRCASHVASKCDISESRRVGESAVRHALAGETGKMMCFRRVKNEEFYRVEIFAESVENVANIVKSIPKNFLSSDCLAVNDKCIDYMLPLINGEIDVIYEDGIPVHFEF